MVTIPADEYDRLRERPGASPICEALKPRYGLA